METNSDYEFIPLYPPYAWNPTSFFYKDPDTNTYKGDVIGSAPLAASIKTIADAGAVQIDAIAQTGAEWIAAVEALEKKYEGLLEVINDVTNAVITNYEGFFALDRSTLDSAFETLY